MKNHSYVMLIYSSVEILNKSQTCTTCRIEYKIDMYLMKRLRLGINLYSHSM